MSDTTPQTDKKPGDNADQPVEAAKTETPKTLEELLADAEARVLEQRDAWLRALADAENARKRAQADIAGAHKYGVERIVEALIPVMDSLQAALADEAADLAALRSGVEITQKQLGAAFEKAGLSEISPAPGDKFDPHVHQAMMAVESEAEPNSVVMVMQKGYLLHDRVVRPALVTVAKARAQT